MVAFSHILPNLSSQSLATQRYMTYAVDKTAKRTKKKKKNNFCSG